MSSAVLWLWIRCDAGHLPAVCDAEILSEPPRVVNMARGLPIAVLEVVGDNIIEAQSKLAMTITKTPQLAFCRTLPSMRVHLDGLLGGSLIQIAR